MAFLSMGPRLRWPLYTLTGYTAALPAEPVVANYANYAAFAAAVPPRANDDRVQLAGYPVLSVVTTLKGQWIAGAWEWVET